MSERRFWKDGNFLYCEESVRIMNRADLSDPNFSEGELRKQMNERMDRTIDLHTNPKNIERMSRYCLHCSPKDNE